MKPLPSHALHILYNEIALELLEAMHEAELTDPDLARIYRVWLSWGPPPKETRYNRRSPNDGGWQ